MTSLFRPPLSHSTTRPLQRLTLLWVLALTGCALAPNAAHRPASTVPAEWQTPLPHQGQLVHLSDWWAQQDDPLLVELIMAAQAVSPSLATARSNIEQARLSRLGSQAAMLPRVDAAANLTRNSPGPTDQVSLPLTTSAQAGLNLSWEIDLFGKLSATRDAGEQRFAGAQARWHSARVSVAAETANQYYQLRACQKLLDVAQSDAASRGETARLSALSTQAGFQAPASDALARASAAESRNQAAAQQALCALDIKALVALSGLPEADLRQKLTATAADRAPDAMLAVASVPAQALAQRPDIFDAAREVDAASAEVGEARAQRYPRLTLNGSINTHKILSPGPAQRFDTWSIGPLQLTVPLLDGGAGKANVRAAQARYLNAAAQYRASVRQAVREVEEALVRLQSTADRNADALIAVEGYRAAFTGSEARYRSGLANLLELEDARRTLLAAQSSVINLQRERRSAWVALYRALGGGWQADSPLPPDPLDFPGSNDGAGGSGSPGWPEPSTVSRSATP